MKTLLICAGLLLFCLFLADDFQQALKRLLTLLKQRPRLRYFVLPLLTLLSLAAAALIARSLLALASASFSYD